MVTTLHNSVNALNATKLILKDGANSEFHVIEMLLQLEKKKKRTELKKNCIPNLTIAIIACSSEIFLLGDP